MTEDQDFRVQVQHAIAQEIRSALVLMAPSYFRDGRSTGWLQGKPFVFISPEGQMSWRDQSGRQVVVTVQVSQP